MTLDEIDALSRLSSLSVFGAFHTTPDDDLDKGTLVLLGPHEPGFWPYVQASPEFVDDQPDPLDRWSGRVITALAQEIGGHPFFPFGTPLRPFMRWAVRSERAWSSPVLLLVHDTAGLMVSYRGAIHVATELALPAPGDRPCETCPDQPCLSACPVDALVAEGYESDACHTFLDSNDGQACMTKGCAVRRSCPISATYGRMAAQSAFHMDRFHP